MGWLALRMPTCSSQKTNPKPTMPMARMASSMRRIIPREAFTGMPATTVQPVGA
ncbi:hypothetical protein D3C86_2067720 [compost metagenome]